MSSTGLPPRNEINNLNNLDYKRPYTEFDYSKYINDIKLSNFTHGGSLNKTKKKQNDKKMNKVLQHMYINYMNGGKSYIKGGGRTPFLEFEGACSKASNGGGVNDFPIPITDTYNTTNLRYNTCYNPEKVRYISKVPYSSFAV